MEHKEILKNAIDSLSTYYEKQNSFKRVFMNEPVMAKGIEVFDDEMDSMLNHIFDLIGIPSEESPNKYEKSNWTRSVCINLIKIAATNAIYVEPAVELISDCENLSDYTSKVESHTWFYHEQLLDEHLTGYKSWHAEQRKKERVKRKSTSN